MNGNQYDNMNGVSGVNPSNSYISQNNINPIQSNNINNQYVGNNSFSDNNYTSTNTNPTYNSNSNNKKILLLAVVAIAVAAIIGFVLFKFVFNGVGSKEKEALNMLFDPEAPIVIEQDNKYGYITSKGKMMIEPKYKSATKFYGDYAIVTVDNPDSYLTNLYQIIDKEGNVLISSESLFAPSFYPEFDIWVIDNQLYNSKLEKVLEEGITVDYANYGYLEYTNIRTNESGIMDHKGKVVFKWEGTSIYTDMIENDYDEKELYALLTSYSEPERQVLISIANGEILYSITDTDKYYLSEDGNGVFHLYNRDKSETEKWFYYRNGKLVYETSDEDIYDISIYDYKKQILKIDYGYDYDELEKEERYAYYDVKKKKILSEKPSLSETDASVNSYGYLIFEASSKYGVIKGNKVVLQPEYDDVDLFNASLFNYMKYKKNKELVLLEKDDSTVLMNLKNKKAIITFDTTSVTDSSTSTFLEAKLYDGDYNCTGYIVYNVLTGKSMNFDKDDDYDIGSNYIKVTEDGKVKYYNTKLDQIYVVEE